jgi:hypothetical protein
MDKKELIDKLIQNENSPYSEADIEHLSTLPDDILKRTFLAIATPPAKSSKKNEGKSINNATDEQVEKAISASRQSLKTVQKQIFELRAAEAKVLDDLSKLGSGDKSIFNVDYSAISESDIELFVQNSQSEVAQVLREALELRNHGRIELMTQVITNSGGLFSEEDLQFKSSEELRKLAALSCNSAQHGALPMTLPQVNGVQNWQGAGMGNALIVNEAGGGEPLGLPSTF